MSSGLKGSSERGNERKINVKEPLVSIIVPVFNSDKYLKNCINSIVNQSYRNLEILLIDDGSTDQSGQICDEYAQKDGRIRIFHNTNHGVSYSRNCGLWHMHGEYVAFIDSDDLVNAKYIENLLKNRFCDLVISEIVEINCNGVQRIKKINQLKLKNDFSSDYSSLMPFLLAPWGKLYKAEIISKHQIFFPEDISWREDQVFNARYCMFVKQYSFNNDAKYYYLLRTEDNLSQLASIQIDNIIGMKKILLEEKQFFYARINSPEMVFCDYCISFWLRANGSYDAFLKRIKIIKEIIGGDYSASSWKRWLILKCLRYQIYRLIYFYYRTKYLLHKWGI